MKGAIALIAVLISGQLCFANATVCDRVFAHSTSDEYLPFPLIDDEFAASSEFKIGGVYIPEADLSLEFEHLMGAEYLVHVTDRWSGGTGRGVAVLTDDMVTGFIELEGSYLLIDIAAVQEGDHRQMYARIDGKCFKAESGSRMLP